MLSQLLIKKFAKKTGKKNFFTSKLLKKKKEKRNSLV